MRRERPLTFEAGKDAEGVNAFGNAAGQGQVAIAHPEHLHALDQPDVSRRASRADRVMRPGDSHVQRDLPGRVVGHRAGIVVVRPEAGIVVVAFDQIHFVLGFDASMLGNADVHADTARVDVGPVDAGVLYSLLGAVDADAAGPRTAADIFARLVSQGVVFANPRQRRAEVTDFIGAHAAAPGQQPSAQLGKRVTVGCRHPHPRDDNALSIGQAGRRLAGDHEGDSSTIQTFETSGLAGNWQADESDASGATGQRSRPVLRKRRAESGTPTRERHLLRSASPSCCIPSSVETRTW